MISKILKITQVRSAIGCKPKHKLSLKGLGLHRIGSIVYRVDTSSIRGMLNIIRYLIKVEYI